MSNRSFLMVIALLVSAATLAHAQGSGITDQLAAAEVEQPPFEPDTVALNRS